MNNTAVQAFKSMRSVPISVLRRVDAYTQAIYSLHQALETVIYHGKTADDEKGVEMAERDTMEV